ncbi:ABC transporter substrate-binding protein [Arsenicitalea aurantiaca]|uniref:ABC transporter substrate-binding protein n=1 Tax=Arsenicitalea aurantiaca TaxID=1783274 RepID=A0A433XAY5_9HYPH|nr:ABC transporter substrate-binding protein [Arsenicitalea aurantiaca]RUT31261.1 ABC transporter substrate-binding protein [Arsenicitalea aurantiaca]
MIFRTLSRSLGALLCAMTLAAPAFAQSVPQELLDNTRRAQIDSLTFCLDPTSVGAPFDRRVAKEIAGALLLNARFADAPSGFALDGAGYMEELQIAMNNRCDVMMGISLQPGSVFPDWLVFTRPYAQVPFVFAVDAASGYQRLGDLPPEATIGTALGSRGEREFIIYNTQQPQSRQWRRLPYADPALMLRRVQDGSLGGMLIWQPALRALGETQSEVAQLRVVPTDPVPVSVVSLGALVSSRDAFLRTQIDEAIGALVNDGTIARLLEELGYEGRPG